MHYADKTVPSIVAICVSVNVAKIFNRNTVEKQLKLTAISQVLEVITTA